MNDVKMLLIDNEKRVLMQRMKWPIKKHRERLLKLREFGLLNDEDDLDTDDYEN